MFSKHCKNLETLFNNNYNKIRSGKENNQIQTAKINLQGGIAMNNNLYMRADEVAKLLGISVSKSYKIIKELNKQQEAAGYLTMHGRLNREFFMEKVYQRKGGN